jgi:adenine-specific DNA-methyltransferase
VLDVIEIPSQYSPKAKVSLYCGDCKEFLPTIPAQSVQLVVTSPPYNIGKKYERKQALEKYIAEQAEVIAQCVRLLRPGGSICWQVGNHIENGEIAPLDVLLYPIFKSHGLHLRNRIIWHFEHGLHCSRRFSGRYETIIWFTKGEDYVFSLDPVRVPQKYPGKKYFKGPKVGQYSSNPLGKNPGDLWIIPNVKHNHPEKTEHPCQFPVELIARLLLSMTNPGDLVLDPFMGVGTTAVAALLHNRRAAGAETEPRYVTIAKERIQLAAAGLLKYRPMNTPIYEPPANSALTQNPF